MLENVRARGAELEARLREIAGRYPIAGELRGRGPPLLPRLHRPGDGRAARADAARRDRRPAGGAAARPPRPRLAPQRDARPAARPDGGRGDRDRGHLRGERGRGQRAGRLGRRRRPRRRLRPVSGFATDRSVASGVERRAGTRAQGRFARRGGDRGDQLADPPRPARRGRQAPDRARARRAARRLAHRPPRGALEPRGARAARDPRDARAVGRGGRLVGAQPHARRRLAAPARPRDPRGRRDPLRARGARDPLDVEVGRDRRRREAGAALRAQAEALERGDAGRGGRRRRGLPPHARLVHAERCAASADATASSTRAARAPTPSTRCPRRPRGSLEQHRRIVEALAASDVERAARLAQEHMLDVARRYSAVSEPTRRTPRDQALQPRPQAARAVAGGVPRALDRRARRDREAAPRACAAT